MEYPEFTWKSIGNDTEQDAQFRSEFMNAFLDGRTLPTPPPVVPHAEAEIPAKLKRESPMLVIWSKVALKCLRM